MTMKQPKTLLEPITSIQPFIDLSYNTVPLNGKYIKRDAKGSKHGFSFPEKWFEVYSNTRNELATPLGGLLTGKDQIVAIDCDCDASWELFRSLDPTYTAYFESIGKKDKEGNLLTCGTLLYLYRPDLIPSKHTKDKFDIDFYNGTGMVFLPTKKNSTKATWLEDEEGILYNHEGNLVELKQMPDTVATVLDMVFTKPEAPKTLDKTVHAQRSKGYLGKLLPNLVMDEGDYNPKVTKILTPMEYRNDLYKKQGHISPSDVGVRHDYLFKIFCRLAGDNTVDQDLAIDTLYYINSLMDEPKPTKKLDTEIISGIVSGRQLNSNGESYWQYDEHWETLDNWTITSRRDGDLCDIFYDPMKQCYFMYNTVTDSIKEFDKKTDLINFIEAYALDGNKGWGDDIVGMATVDTVVKPTEDFGYLDDDRLFNQFEPTEALRILADPKSHEDDYIEPQEFMQFMEHFIPDEQQRTYLLRLLRTKLTTFEYSPVVPYIIGIAGSGKGLLMSVIENLVGRQYVAKDLSGGLFINSFNKWLEYKYFVNLNELAEGLTTKTERTKAVGDLKLYTGSTTFQCHGKNSNSYTADSTAMFIMTANSNPLPLDDDDRRVYYISTPNTFNSSPQCLASKDSGVIFKAIMAQTKDIAYWLATEITNLSSNDYTTAPRHTGRGKVLFDSKVPSQKIAWALKIGEFKLLEDYLLSPDPIFSHHADNRVFLDDVVSVYSEMVTSDNPEQVMKRAMKDMGFKQKQGYKNAVYWDVNNFSDYSFDSDLPTDEEAEDIRL